MEKKLTQFSFSRAPLTPSLAVKLFSEMPTNPKFSWRRIHDSFADMVTCKLALVHRDKKITMQITKGKGHLTALAHNLHFTSE